MEKTIQKFVVVHDERVVEVISKHAKILRKQAFFNAVLAGCLAYILLKLNKAEKGEQTEGEK